MGKRLKLIGKRFGKLVVMEEVIKETSVKNTYWLCQCDCGKTKVMKGAALTSGHAQSCGCVRYENVRKSRFINLIGKIFGKLTVIKQIETPENRPKGIYWLCQCECGNEKNIEGNSLRNGNTKSCGCLSKEINRKKWEKDLVGKKFDRLLVLEEVDPPQNLKKRYHYWKCLCDCGNIKIICGHSLLNKRTRSCGCLQKEHSKLGKYKNDNELRKLKKVESYIKGRAKYTKLEYNLSTKDLENLIYKECNYCGKSPNNTMILPSKEEFKFNGLDRIDSSKGYIIGNVVPCCIECNQSKMNMSVENFLNHIEQIYNHSIKYRMHINE